MQINHSSKGLSRKIIGTIIIIGVIYLVVSTAFLLPYLFKFFYGEYKVEVNDLPNYSDIFNSIFSVISILATSYLSYLIYRLTKKQNHDSYNLNIASPAYIILKSFEIHIVNSLMEDYNKYETDSNKLTPFRYINGEELFSNVSKIIGCISEDELKDRLYNLYFIIDKDSDFNYILDEKFIIKSKITKQDLEKLLSEIVGNHEYSYISNNEHRSTLKELYKLSKTRSIYK